jgi:hypothetical protein
MGITVLSMLKIPIPVYTGNSQLLRENVTGFFVVFSVCIKKNFEQLLAMGRSAFYISVLTGKLLSTFERAFLIFRTRILPPNVISVCTHNNVR